MKKLLAIFIFIFTLGLLQTVPVFAINAELAYQNAGKAYESKNYLQALKLYQSILETNLASSEVYFNTGNCYFKLDSIGRAIQYYEKAHNLNASDEDYNFNLKMAQAQTIDKIEPLPEFIIASTWRNFVNSQTADNWGRWCIVFISLTFLLLIIFYVTKIPNLKRVLFLGSIFFIVISAAFYGLASIKKSNDSKALKGVILASSVEIKSAPINNSTNLFVVHEGTVFKIIEKNNLWCRIRLDNGNSGWINSQLIGEI
jgi:tetratricopeptide (TPR) repeat protein